MRRALPTPPPAQPLAMPSLPDTPPSHPTAVHSPVYPSPLPLSHNTLPLLSLSVPYEGLRLAHAVVIFDEAHNLVDAINHMHSAEVRPI